jgi:hypothetical protein
MKKNLLIFVFILLNYLSTAQSLFYKVYNYPNQVDFGCVVKHSSFGFIATAGGPGNLQYLVRTYDNGDTLWAKSYSNVSVYTRVIQTNDGGYMLSSSSGIIKTNWLGNVSWAKQTASTLGPYVIRQTSDGGYIMTGGFLSPFVFKLNSNGDFVWEKFYNIYWTNGPGQGYTTDIQQTSDGGYIILGNTYMYGAGSSDYCLTRTDNAGNVLWYKTYGSTGQDLAEAMQITPDGGFVITGRTSSSGAGSSDMYVVKTDDNGNLMWSKTYGGSDSDYGTSISITSDNGYLLCGPSYSFPGGPLNKVCVIKTDDLGSVSWSNAYMYSANTNMANAAQTASGGYIIGGSYSFGPNGAIILIKTDTAGNIGCFQYPAPIIEGVPITQVGSPNDTVYDFNDTLINMSVAVFSGLTISVPCITNLPEQTESSIAIYPNPVSNKLTIEFADDNFANEEYCIFNVYGQLVLKGEMRSRKNDLDLSTLDDGVYIIDIKGVQSSLRKRIIKQ